MHSAGPHDPLQAWQRPPEHRRLTVYPPSPPPYRRFQHRWRVHIVLFLLTVVTTTLVGLEHYASFVSGFGTRTILPGLEGAGFGAAWSMLWHAYGLQALVYSGSVLGILGAHEMGHYVA